MTTSQITSLWLYSGFNNYYNRTIKRKGYEAFPDYGEPLLSLGAINFNHNDGVNASVILNIPNALWNEEPDYAITVSNQNGYLTRWFVLETKRMRNGQSELVLRRDLVADFYDDVINAPMFVEKAMLDSTNPLIYNSENMTYNRIKTKEVPVKDKTGIPWIVGYIDQRATDDVETVLNTITVDAEYSTWEDFGYAEYTYGISANITGIAEEDRKKQPSDYITAGFGIVAKDDNVGSRYFFGWNENGEITTVPAFDGTFVMNGVYKIGDWVLPTPVSGTIRGGYTFKEVRNAIEAYNTANPYNWKDVIYSYTNIPSQPALDDFMLRDGKVYKIGDKYFRFTVKGKADWVEETIQYNSSGAAIQQFRNIADNSYINRENSLPYYLRITYYNLYLEAEELINESVSIHISETRTHLTDAPYDMFCIPYGAYTVSTLASDTSDNITYNNPNFMMNVAAAIQRDLADNVYDIQLLPYCPLSDGIISYDGIINLDIIPETGYIEITDGADNIQGHLFWCDRSSFTTTAAVPGLDNYDYVPPFDDGITYKILHETEMMRLCSPNYNGSFEFNAMSNGGLGANQQFNITCSYKPYSPYIKVAPNFGSLYGRNFDDARGLICGGDFSLPQTKDAWESYQINNKNYQVMFDRQIQNMEINNRWQMGNTVANAIAGTAESALSGGYAGTMLGGSAAVGAGIGAGIGAVGGVLDIAMTAALQKETLDYTKDNFGYQLGNIQALPLSITKVSAFNDDNKIFPFVEKYEATPEEKEALRQKIKYNGMTVMTIGNMADYIKEEPTYIKGKLIRLENVSADYHIVLELASEINKGVYI